MNKQLVPSLLAFDKKYPYEQLKIFKKHHLQTIHYDVMDLTYVNNTAFETEHLEWLLKNDFLVHIHLMVINPLKKLNNILYINQLAYLFILKWMIIKLIY